MIYLVREIAKICMFAILWAFPLLLIKWTGNGWYVLLFTVSIILTMGLFAHFEKLEEIDHNQNCDDEEDSK